MSRAAPAAIAPRLLEWYDRSARTLPWRVGPAARRAGVRPDPYRVWLSEIMLQQTTTAAVAPYFAAFTERWPTVEALADAPRDDVLSAWAGLGYYARARNLHACAALVAERHGGRFPDDEDGLRALPGVGAYTAAAVAAIAFDRRAVVVDGNVERVMARLFQIEEPLPASKPALKAAAARATPEAAIGRYGDYAQAVMDLGATICTPKSPACGVCPVLDFCAARRAGLAAALPRKTRKAPKPTRRGVAFLVLDSDGRALFERRPDKGLLGGMLGLPGTDWAEGAPSADAVRAATPAFGAALDWREAEEEALHTFTHFHLRLTVRVARASRRACLEGEGRIWIATDDIAASAAPTLTRKAVLVGLAALAS